MSFRVNLYIFAVSASVSACGVERQGSESGGLDLDGSIGGAGAGGWNDAGTGARPAGVRGFAVVNSDAASTSVSLLSVSGRVESAGFISSSSRDPGLSAALSGDVVLPTSGATNDELVLIDRFPASVLTWVDLRSAKVRAQLSVSTGFVSNPHDYVPFTETKAFVPRFAANLDSGREAFDQGNDVLVIDPKAAEIVDRIELGPAFSNTREGIHPCADRAFMAGGKLRVFAVGFNADFTDRVDSRLITIDPETHGIDDVLVFEGMHSCGSAALSPDGTEMAVACTGAFGQDTKLGFPDSGALVVSVADHPEEKLRWTSSELGISQVSSLSWLSDDQVAVLTFGRYIADRTDVEVNDAARTLNVRDGSLTEPWFETPPFKLGDIACLPGEGTCLLADAKTEGGVVHELSIGASGKVMLTGSVKPDAVSGLPPRSFGTF